MACKYVLIAALFGALTTTASAARHSASDLLILGWVETVILTEPGYELPAKLDSGAATSSLDARIIKKFRKGGKRWVRFAVTDPASGEEHVLVRERIRTIGVVEHDGDNQIRPTVMMQVCIADHLLDIEVSLTDRSEFNYRLLLGRRALASIALIDPSETFLSDAECAIAEPDAEAS
jgi:hypothetical protein